MRGVVRGSAIANVGTAMAVVMVAGAFAGCARGSDVLSTPTSAVPTTGDVAPTTVPPPTTSEPPPPTSTTSTTITPTTTSPPTSTAVEQPAADRPATAFVVADQDLIEIDVATGATLRVLAEYFNGDGMFRGGLRLTPDRTAIWFAEGYEDSWYGCESSVGSRGHVDVASGALQVFDGGTSPEPSPDGEFVAYLASDLCLPDPEAPEFWVLTPFDRVVVQQIGTGETREFVTNSPPDAYGAPGAVEWAAFSPDGGLLVLTADGQLRDVDIDGSEVLQDHPVVLADVMGYPVAALADALLTVVLGDEGSSDLFSIDLLTGAPTLLASSEVFMTAGVSADGHIVVVSSDVVTIASGADVAILTMSADEYAYSIDW